MAESEFQEKIRDYVQRLRVQFEAIGDNIWLLHCHERGLPHVVLYAESGLVTVRAKVMEIPGARREAFFEDLLRLNIEMLHGAYALEENAVIWVDTLEFTTMDFEEFQASLDAASLSVAAHYPRLAKYRDGGINGTV